MSEIKLDKGHYINMLCLKSSKTLAKILGDITDKLPGCVLDVWQNQWLKLNGYPRTFLAESGRKAQRAKEVGTVEWI